MSSFLKDNDLITIDTNRKIFILKTFEYNNGNYAFCKDVTDTNKDNDLYIMVKEINNEEETPLIDILTNSEEIETLLQYFRTLV